MVSVPCYKKGLLIVCFNCWKQKVYNSTSHSVKLSPWQTAGPLTIFEIWPLQFKLRHTFKVVLSTVSVLLKVAIHLQGNVTAVFKTMVRKTQTSQTGRVTWGKDWWSRQPEWWMSSVWTRCAYKSAAVFNNSSTIH